MTKTVVIYADNSIVIQDRDTFPFKQLAHFRVKQTAEGTKVFQLLLERGRIKSRKPIVLKRDTYSLACTEGKPACGYNRSDFVNDLLEAYSQFV